MGENYYKSLFSEGCTDYMTWLIWILLLFEGFKYCTVDEYFLAAFLVGDSGLLIVLVLFLTRDGYLESLTLIETGELSIF